MSILFIIYYMVQIINQENSCQIKLKLELTSLKVASYNITAKKTKNNDIMSPAPPGVPGSGQAPPLLVPVSSGFRGSAGLPAPAVCHRVRKSEADRPG